MSDGLLAFGPVPPIAGIMGALWALLVAAAASFAAVARLRPGSVPAEIKPRLRTWVAILAAVTLAVLVGPGGIIALCALMSFLALREFFGIVPLRPRDRAATAVAYVMVPMQYGLVLTHWYGLFAIALPVYGFAGLAIANVAAGETRGFIRSTAILHWGVMLAVFGLSHLAFLAVLLLARPAASGGVGLFIFVLVLIEANDVAQFAWGRTLGGARVVPAVSPGKTWAGLIGGALTTAALAVLLGRWTTPFGASVDAAFGFGLAVLGFWGDVVLSAVKRDLGLKDAGRSLPGHGGYLDRLDSLVLAAPVAFHAIRYFYGA